MIVSRVADHEVKEAPLFENVRKAHVKVHV